MLLHITDPPPPFSPRPPGSDGTITWIHVGDLHMRKAGQQNEVDLRRIVDVINEVYAAPGVSFVYLPGDIADDGSAAAYSVVRSHLDRLQLPWCGIVGDHDVHGGSFTNFQAAIDPQLTSSFAVGRYRFLRLNAFARPQPEAFAVDDAQLAWIEGELQECVQQQQRAVLLLHCYPSDLNEGGKQLAALLRRFPVLLVDMGHTHYNELSNDGRVIYSATRSTGQIEEGAVGFSVITLDADRVSWHFVEPDAPDLVNITAPADRRLVTGSGVPADASAVEVRAKVWSRLQPAEVKASLLGVTVSLAHRSGVLWSGSLPAAAQPRGTTAPLLVQATPHDGTPFHSSVDVVWGKPEPRAHDEVDQENSIGAWQERSILGTQLGPNKNGRKW